MILYSVTMLFQCFYLFVFAMQQVNAKDDKSARLTFWDSFDWKITIQRHRQDIIALKGLFNIDSADLEDIKIPGATCNETEKRTAKLSRPGFVKMHCKCNLESSTFDAKRMTCVANKKLKQGCRFTTGSWRWSTSWIWSKVDDPLIVLDIKHAYGITTGFNATTIEYQFCTVESINYLGENKLETSNSSFINYSKPAMFKLHNIWHLSWNVDNLPAEVKKSLEGKFLKFQIECEKPGPPENEDEELQISSCIVVKVAGQLTVQSKSWGKSQLNITNNIEANITKNIEANITNNIEAQTSANDESAFLIPLLVSMAIVLTVVVAIAVCYTRRLVCFAQRVQSHEIILPDDTVVETELMKNVHDESVA
ncbi:uncharacterized protein LOC114522042 [Dendronephthya gigantea]|uniref:uncharacterized protein LOC114522042 n=1 Tax=Dendronephthya gigantea TaxID=151771 RepID=UPI00106BB71F|nr:uncharacterized protein LOC114522042 [Dendronephthya gigantea]XP_028398449.1 uncharacterized protein LOC114522042 [Dendronephthya gigantea]